MDDIVDTMEKTNLFPNMKNFIKLYGIINLSPVGYGHFSYPIVEEPSSDEDEDKFEDDDIEMYDDEFSDDEGMRKASVNLVCEKLIDPATIMIIVRIMC